MEVPVLAPRDRGTAGCCEPFAEPQIGREHALRLAATAKALSDPTRVVILDVLRNATPEAVCQCELIPLFQMSQPALAKHLKVLINAGIVATERRGLWAYYYVNPDALEELSIWLD